MQMNKHDLIIRILDYYGNVYNDNYHLKKVIGKRSLQRITNWWLGTGYLEGLSGDSLLNVVLSLEYINNNHSNGKFTNFIVTERMWRDMLSISVEIISKINFFDPPYIVKTTDDLLEKLMNITTEWSDSLINNVSGKSEHELELKLYEDFISGYKLPECK